MNAVQWRLKTAPPRPSKEVREVIDAVHAAAVDFCRRQADNTSAGLAYQVPTRFVFVAPPPFVELFEAHAPATRELVAKRINDDATDQRWEEAASIGIDFAPEADATACTVKAVSFEQDTERDRTDTPGFDLTGSFDQRKQHVGVRAQRPVVALDRVALGIDDRSVCRIPLGFMLRRDVGIIVENRGADVRINGRRLRKWGTEVVRNDDELAIRGDEETMIYTVSGLVAEPLELAGETRDA